MYQNKDVGRYIRLLSPLLPIMYMDSVVDAHLKGLGFQVYSMGINIADAALSVVAVMLLLPAFGAEGYVLVIYFTELFNFTLSLRRLKRALPISFSSGALLSPLLSGVFVICLVPLLLPYRLGLMPLACRFLVGGSLFLLLYLFLNREPSFLRRKTER